MACAKICGTPSCKRDNQVDHEWGRRVWLAHRLSMRGERGAASTSIQCSRSPSEGDFFSLFVLLCGKWAHTVPHERKAAWELLSAKLNSSLNCARNRRPGKPYSTRLGKLI